MLCNPYCLLKQKTLKDLEVTVVLRTGSFDNIDFAVIIGSGSKPVEIYFQPFSCSK